MLYPLKVQLKYLIMVFQSKIRHWGLLFFSLLLLRSNIQGSQSSKHSHDKPSLSRRYSHGQQISEEEKKEVQTQKGQDALRRELTNLCKEATSPKPVVMFMGPTGSGKSTTIAFMQGCTLDYKRAKRRTLYTKVSIVNIPKTLTKVPKIGDGLAETVGCCIYEYSDPKIPYCFCDTEGYLGSHDADSASIMVSAFAPYFALFANKIKGIALVFDKSSIAAVRSENFRQVVGFLVKHFGKKSLYNLRDSLMLIVTKVDSSKRAREECLENFSTAIRTCYLNFYKKSPSNQIGEVDAGDIKQFCSIFLTEEVRKEDVKSEEAFIVDEGKIVFLNPVKKPQETREKVIEKIKSLKPLEPARMRSMHSPLIESSLSARAKYLNEMALFAGQGGLQRVRNLYYRVLFLRNKKHKRHNEHSSKVLRAVKAREAKLKRRMDHQNEDAEEYKEEYKRANPYREDYVIKQTKKAANTGYKVTNNQLVTALTLVSSTVVALEGVEIGAGVGFALGGPFGGLVGAAVGAVTGFTVNYMDARISQVGGGIIIGGVTGTLGAIFSSIDYAVNGYLAHEFVYNGREKISKIECNYENGALKIALPNEKLLKKRFNVTPSPGKLTLKAKGAGVSCNPYKIGYATDYAKDGNATVMFYVKRREHSTADQKAIRREEEELKKLFGPETSGELKRLEQELKKATKLLKAYEDEIYMFACLSSNIYLFNQKSGHHTTVRDCLETWETLPNIKHAQDMLRGLYNPVDEEDEKKNDK